METWALGFYIFERGVEMDTLKIESKFMRKVASNAIAKAAERKFDKSIGVDIHELEITHDENGAKISFSGEASIPESDLRALLIGLL